MRRDVNGQSIFFHALYVACGGNLRELEGVITGPTNLPFNETSYVCYWTLEPPENMISSANDSSMTMTIKVNGYLGGFESRSTNKKNCLSSQFQLIELEGKTIDTIQVLSVSIWQLLNKMNKYYFKYVQKGTLCYRHWNVVWKSNGAEIFEKSKINQPVDGIISVTYIILSDIRLISIKIRIIRILSIKGNEEINFNIY